MRIAQLASSVESVPPKGYGGIELIVHLLTEELVRRGHDVTLFASGDSVTSARLVSVVDVSLRTGGAYLSRQWPAFEIRTILKLKEMEDEFDIVHNHMGWQALPYLAQMHCPSVTTNHNQVKEYCSQIYLAFKELPYVAISDMHRKLNYAHELNYVATIYNGIDVDRFSADGESNRSYLLFVGRVCNDKGTAEAVEVAHKLSLPLKIAGKIDEADTSYFNERVKPHLSSNREYVGEVSHTEKVELYRQAIAVVYPINFEEPFGLVMAEAMASGTPVMAFDRGSVREVLSDGETAIIAKCVDELIDRFPEIEKISSYTCRKRAIDLFSAQTMVDRYEKLYNRLTGESGGARVRSRRSG